MDSLKEKKQNSSILRTYGISPSPPLVVLSMEEANLTTRHSEARSAEESLKPSRHSEPKAKNPGVNNTSLDPSPLYCSWVQDDKNHSIPSG